MHVVTDDISPINKEGTTQNAFLSTYVPLFHQQCNKHRRNKNASEVFKCSSSLAIKEMQMKQL